LFRLKFVNLGSVGVDELGPVDRGGLVHDLAQFLSKNDCDRARIARVDWNRKGAGVASVSVDRAGGLPDTVGMAGRMIAVADEEDFGPKILVQLMLVFDDREIVAGRNDAVVEDDEVTFVWRKDNGLLGATAQSDAGEEDGRAVRNFTDKAEIHERRPRVYLLDL